MLTLLAKNLIYMSVAVSSTEKKLANAMSEVIRSIVETCTVVGQINFNAAVLDIHPNASTIRRNVTAIMTVGIGRMKMDAKFLPSHC